MTLRNAAQAQIEMDDDDGTGTFSKIDRLCGNDSLAPGDYFVEVSEFDGTNQIDPYNLALTITPCGTCQPTVTLANMTLTTNQTHLASGDATLGPNLTVNAAAFGVYANNQVTFVSDTTIGGGFVAGLGACP